MRRTQKRRPLKYPQKLKDAEQFFSDEDDCGGDDGVLCNDRRENTVIHDNNTSKFGHGIPRDHLRQRRGLVSTRGSTDTDDVSSTVTNDDARNSTSSTFRKEYQLSKENVMMGISKVFKNSVIHKRDEEVETTLKKVVALHLQKKGFESIAGDVFYAFRSLAHLYLYDNKIEKMSQAFSCLPQLESLHLSGNRIRRIENLENCFNLRQLYLGNNEIEVVEGLENLTMLVELHVENQRLPLEQPLIFCPNSLDTISRKLKVLNTSGNQLESIDEILIGMDVLDTLNLSKNKIVDLDHASIILRTLRQIRVLDLRENRIVKDPSYKEKILGFCNFIELLDSKEVNDTQRQTLQRLCSVKAKRRQNQAGKRISQPPTTSYSAPGLRQQITREDIHRMSMPLAIQVTDLHDQFQFSTPISSASPIDHQPWEGHQSDTDKELYLDERIKQEQQVEELYNSRNFSNKQQGAADSMSEMAKIIFKLSNLSPSASSVGSSKTLSHRLPPYHFQERVSSSYKESRPLSPLEVDATTSSSAFTISSNNIGRKRSPIRRPLARKLPPRHSVQGAGRMLSPLEEGSECSGQSLLGSTCSLPPWQNIERKKGVSRVGPNFS